MCYKLNSNNDYLWIFTYPEQNKTNKQTKPTIQKNKENNPESFEVLLKLPLEKTEEPDD